MFNPTLPVSTLGLAWKASAFASQVSNLERLAHRSLLRKLDQYAEEDSCDVSQPSALTRAVAIIPLTLSSSSSIGMREISWSNEDTSTQTQLICCSARQNTVDAAQLLSNIRDWLVLWKPQFHSGSGAVSKDREWLQEWPRPGL